MKQNKKSPLKAKPLRNPGQSLDEEIDKLINEEAGSYIFASVFVVCQAGYEWWRYFYNPPPHPPITLSVVILLFALYCAYKINKISQQVKSIKLGRDGEKEVGQYLDCLREKGCRIFHDVLGENFNLDHVIVSKKGIFVVETKTYRKPEKGVEKKFLMKKDCPLTVLRVKTNK